MIQDTTINKLVLQKMLSDQEIVAVLRSLCDEERIAWEQYVIQEAQSNRPGSPDPTIIAHYGARALGWRDVMGTLYKHAGLKEPVDGK